MARDEEEEGGCYPDPSDLNKVDIEDICLFGKIAGRVVGCITLRGGFVGCNLVVDGEGAEEGAEEECSWVERQQDCFERRW